MLIWDNSDTRPTAPATVKVLRDDGANPSNALSPDGYTILHFADDFEAFEVIKVLSDAGADVMARDQYDWTLLRFVSKRWAPQAPGGHGDRPFSSCGGGGAAGCRGQSGCLEHAET